MVTRGRRGHVVGEVGDVAGKGAPISLPKKGDSELSEQWALCEKLPIWIWGVPVPPIISITLYRF